MSATRSFKRFCHKQHELKLNKARRNGVSAKKIKRSQHLMDKADRSLCRSHLDGGGIPGATRWAKLALIELR